LRILAALPASVNRPLPLIPDAPQRGLALVEKFRSKDAEGALDILVETTALDPKNETLKPLKKELLNEAIAARPDHLNRVVELALIYEAEQQLDESVKLLLPYQQKLGDTEGARILGQHLLGENRNEEAYPLLFAYVQTRLERLRSIERSYTNTIATVSQRILDDLNAGRGDQSFYDSYDKAASKAAKSELVDEYIQKRMQADPSFRRVLAELEQANQIVHVALDLGLVQLNRAQGFHDPDARKTELGAAEKTFLAVRGFAGETDEYRMFLGQVYYWLGKSQEGRELFDQLLAKHKRAVPILISLARTLRAVGSQEDARDLAEEAFRTAKSNKDKHIAAALRALLFKDIDDQIAWLEKSDLEDNWIQVELNSTRGKKALQQGNKAQAATFLRNAIGGYEKQSRSASSLNNCGLAYFNLYEATGDAAAFKRGLDLLDEAIRMAPADSILLFNTMHQLIARAVMDTVRDAIHLEALGEQPDIHLLAHLYRNDEERAPVYQKLRENENMKRALTYLDKALLLAPKNRRLYATAIGLQGSFRDLAELQKLQQRFHIAAPDFNETRDETLHAYARTNNSRDLAEVQVQIHRYEQALQNPAVRDHPLTYEHVMVTLNTLQPQAWSCGGNVDSTRLLADALATYQKHKSSASRYTLGSAYFFRASEELAKQNADYAAIAEQTRRSLPAKHRLALVLTRGGPLADLARKNENLRRGVALVEEGAQDFPSWASIEEWAVLSRILPDKASLLAARYKQNATARLLDDLQYKFNPLAATTVLEQFWTQELLGDEKHATQIYQQAIREGVPLPAL